MLTEDAKKEILENEEFVSHIAKLRNFPEKPVWWKSTLTVSVITALVTAIITIGGGYIAQLSIKTKELDQLRLEYEQNKKRETIASAWELVARTQKASDDRLSLARGKYDEFEKKMRDEITRDTNLADTNWRVEREHAELLIYLHYSSRKDILKAWNQMRTDLQSYCDCAENTFYKFQNGYAPSSACSDEAKKVTEAQEMLRSLIVDEYLNFIPPPK